MSMDPATRVLAIGIFAFQTLLAALLVFDDPADLVGKVLLANLEKVQLLLLLFLLLALLLLLLLLDNRHLRLVQLLRHVPRGQQDIGAAAVGKIHGSPTKSTQKAQQACGENVQGSGRRQRQLAPCNYFHHVVVVVVERSTVGSQ